MKTIYLRFLFIISIAALLAACTATTVPTPAPLSTAPAVVPTAVITATPAPTATPPPQAFNKLLLVAPPTANAALANSMQIPMVELARSANLTLDSANDLQPARLAGVKLAVIISAPANLAQVAASAPQTQFLVFTDTDLKAGVNINVARYQPQYLMFTTGFLGATLSPEWRFGALLPSDGADAPALLDAFQNGARYYCGTCLPGAPPRLNYPAVTSLPSASAPAAWLAAVNDLLTVKKVDVLYLAPEAAHADVIKAMTGKKVTVISTSAPADGLRSQWAATINLDAAAILQSAWKDISTGKTAGQYVVNLKFSETNREKVSLGRQAYAEGVYAALLKGQISPLSVP